MDFHAAILLIEPAAFVAGLAAIRIPVPVIEQRRAPVLVILAVLSAAGAVAAGGSATGWAPIDILSLAALGGVSVYAGSRAPSQLLVFAAIAAAAAGTGSAGLPLALAALGLALASVLAEAEAAVDAAAGGLLAQSVLRSSNPNGEGLTAVVAALILVPILVSAFRTLRRRNRTRVLRAGLGLLGFAVAAGIIGAVAAFSAVGPLRRGLTVASIAIDTTGTGGLETTARGLKDAGADFATARRSLEAWWAWPARAVPFVGQQWQVLRAAAASGQELAAAGQRALTAPALADVRVTDGRVPLDQLAAIERPVADLAARATAARQRLGAARSAFLVPPLADEIDEQLERVGAIERTVQLANRVLPMVPRLFGGEGTRRYFLAVQTPVESRAGGGFMGNFGEIVAENGSLTLARLGRQDDLTLAPGQAERRLQGSDEYLARYGRFLPERHWANVNLSPDFPTDARVIANLYPQSGGAPVDGVIAVDPAALAAVLSLVGPVEVPSWPTPLSADNALKVLLFDQYQTDQTRAERVDFLGEVAEQAWRRLTGGNLPPLPQLLNAFGPAVQDKHIFFWSNRPDEQRLFEDMEAAGRVPPVNGDFIGLVTQNAVGNKIDYYLRRDVEYRAHFDPRTGDLRATARISLHNEAPAEGAGVAMIGNDLVPRLPSGTNRLYLSFYTPWELVSGEVDGTRIDFERASELGRRVYSTAVDIPPRSTVILELDLAGRMPEDDTYRLDVYRQPHVAADDVTATLALAPGWLGVVGEEEHTSRIRLESDATVEVPLGRR